MGCRKLVKNKTSGVSCIVDYNKIIADLQEECKACNYRYVLGDTTHVPAYYQQKIRKAVEILLECKEDLEDLEHEY